MATRSLSARLAKQLGVKPKAAKGLLDALAVLVTEDLAAGEPVMLPNVGKFSVVERTVKGLRQRVCRFEYVTALKKPSGSPRKE